MITPPTVVWLVANAGHQPWKTYAKTAIVVVFGFTTSPNVRRAPNATEVCQRSVLDFVIPQSNSRSLSRKFQHHTVCNSNASTPILYVTLYIVLKMQATQYQHDGFYT